MEQSINANDLSITIDQGAVVRILIPVVDASGNPVDLTDLDELCFTYGKETSFPGEVVKRAGDDPGCEIVTDTVGLGDDYEGVENNALRVTLGEEETRITPGRIYIFAVWARGAHGMTLLAQGEMEVVGTVWC